MLSWVVKVVPQLPEPPSKNTEDQKEGKPDAAPPPAEAPPPMHEKKVTFEDECKQEAVKTEKSKQDTQTAAGNGPAPNMLTWISSTLPQPAVPANLNRAKSTSKEETAAASKPEDERGMIAWISQGLEKVVPQPELKSKESSAAEQQVQVHQTAPPPEPQISVKDVDQSDKTPPPSMMDWIKHGIVKVVPQPEIPSKTDGTKRTEEPATIKAPPPASMTTTETESGKEAEHQANMMGWIVSGIGRMLPQPAPKLDAGHDEVQTRGKVGLSP